jgi:hypothetical protein
VTTPELKPCPFCGAKLEIRWREAWHPREAPFCLLQRAMFAMASWNYAAYPQGTIINGSDIEMWNNRATEAKA